MLLLAAVHQSVCSTSVSILVWHLRTTPKHPGIFAVQESILYLEVLRRKLQESGVPLQLNCPELGLQEALPIPVAACKR